MIPEIKWVGAHFKKPYVQMMNAVKEKEKKCIKAAMAQKYILKFNSPVLPHIWILLL